MNRDLSSNFGWLRNTNHMKFTEECLMHTEKYVSAKRIFTNWAKHWVCKTRLSQRDGSRRGNIYGLSGNEKVLSITASKEGHADNFLGYHHHHVVTSVCISLTFYRHPSLSCIASSRSSGRHPVCTQSCCI